MHIDAAREQLVRDRTGEAKTASRVLAIGDDEIERKLLAQRGSSAATTSRPGFPMISPMNKMRMEGL